MKLYANVIGKGKPLIILHGFLGMGDNWKTLANQYVELGFEVHLIDQRNHGRSPHSDEFSYHLLQEDLLTYLKHNQLNKIDLIGHSMGGKTAMTFACLHPEYINKLIVVDIAPKYYAPHHQTILEGLTAVKEANFTSRADADKILSKYIEEKSVRQFLLKNLYRTKEGFDLRINLSALKSNINQIGSALDAEQAFNGSVLFVKGALSSYISETDFNVIYNHFPKATIETIQNSGHWVHAEQHKDFFEKTKSFLDQ